MKVEGTMRPYEECKAHKDANPTRQRSQHNNIVSNLERWWEYRLFDPLFHEGTLSLVARFEPTNFGRWIPRTCDWTVGVVGVDFKNVTDVLTHTPGVFHVPMVRRIEGEVPVVSRTTAFHVPVNHRFCSSGPIEKKLPWRDGWTWVSRSPYFDMDRRGQGVPQRTTRMDRMFPSGWLCFPLVGDDWRWHRCQRRVFGLFAACACLCFDRKDWECTSPRHGRTT